MVGDLYCRDGQLAALLLRYFTFGGTVKSTFAPSIMFQTCRYNMLQLQLQPGPSTGAPDVNAHWNSSVKSCEKATTDESLTQSNALLTFQ
jgi:hypothetical protein